MDKKDIVLIIVLGVAFLLIAVLLCNIMLKGKKTKAKADSKQAKPNDTKSEKSPLKEDNKAKEADANDKKADDIPEILKEVTQGNYMFETAKLSEDEQLKEDMVENPDINKQTDEKPFRVMLGEILDDDMQAISTRDIIEEMDNEAEAEFWEDQSSETQQNADDQIPQNKAKNIKTEIDQMSPQMKAIIIADILKKKE